MDERRPYPFLTVAGLAAGALLFAGGAGLAFAGWIDHGPSLFMALVESGLSCF